MQVKVHRKVKSLLCVMACAMLCATTLIASASEQSLANSATAPQTTAPASTGAAPETQSLHIQVGRSVIISLQSRLRRVVISNPNVLDTITATPTQLVVSAKAAGTSSLMLWAETGPARILEVYADVDVSGLRDALSQALPGQPLQAQAEEGRIVLTGTASTPAVVETAVKIASQYSKDVVNSLIVPPPPRGKQVMLKVRFAEVDRTKLNTFGINILSTGAANTVGATSTQQFSPFTLGSNGQGSVTGTIGAGNQGFTSSFGINNLLNIFVFRPDLNLGAAIAALQSKNVLQILAEPNLMARSGEPARFLAGGEFPFPVVQGGATFNAVTIQFRPFGVKLDFTGTIGDDNVVRLKVAPEVSTLDYSNAVTISGFTIPAISTRRAETEVELRDGQSFGIAGLLDQRTTAQFEKIPGIGDIPILGLLFKSKQLNRSNSELLVLITPTIVDPVNAAAATSAKVPSGPLENLKPGDFDKSISHDPASDPKSQK